MIDALRDWIINISAVLIFITAVELILPNNAMKKYSKFVLGLLLISVLMKPIVTLVNRNYDFKTYTYKASQIINSKNYTDNLQTYKDKSIQNTMQVFKANLEDTYTKLLKEKYPDLNYKLSVGVRYDAEQEGYVIGSVKVGVKEGTIEKVKKVDIKANSNYENAKDAIDHQNENNIREYLSSEMKISKEQITIYKL